MAESLDDGMFWLPPRILSDDDEDDVLADEDNKGLFGGNSNWSSNSPVESVISTTETETDEDDDFNDLTLPLTDTTPIEQTNNHAKAEDVFKSPQSTLSPVNGGNAANGQTQDLLFAAAGEVEKMRTPPLPVTIPYHSASVNEYDYHSYTNLKPPFSRQTLEQLKAEQLRQMRMKAAKAWAEARGIKPLGLGPSAWPSLQQAKQKQQQGKNGGMKNVFPASNGDCAGTGVFFPRAHVRFESSRNMKPGYVTGYVPKNAVQSPLTVGGAAVDLGGNDTCASCHKREKRCDDGIIEPQPDTRNEKLQLPPEWMY